MKNDNIVQIKSYAFAIRIVKAYQFLNEHKKEFVLSKQLLRCGTSIGANMTISYKEARETHYWIRLLKDTDYLSEEQSESLLKDVTELLKIIGSIQKTLRNS